MDGQMDGWTQRPIDTKIDRQKVDKDIDNGQTDIKTDGCYMATL
jgi:hypothetical protein